MHIEGKGLWRESKHSRQGVDDNADKRKNFLRFLLRNGICTVPVALFAHLLPSLLLCFSHTINQIWVFESTLIAQIGLLLSEITPLQRAPCLGSARARVSRLGPSSTHGRCPPWCSGNKTLTRFWKLVLFCTYVTTGV